MGTLTDITRLRKNNEKRKLSWQSIHIKAADITVADYNLLANLPPNALITDVGVVVDVAGQGGLTVDIGTGGNNALLAAADLSATGYKTGLLPVADLTLTNGTPNTLSSGHVTKSPRTLTGTGYALSAKFSSLPTSGEFRILVEYVEYTLGNGDLTTISPS